MRLFFVDWLPAKQQLLLSEFVRLALPGCRTVRAILRPHQYSFPELMSGWFGTTPPVSFHLRDGAFPDQVPRQLPSARPALPENPAADPPRHVAHSVPADPPEAAESDRPC